MPTGSYGSRKNSSKKPVWMLRKDVYNKVSGDATEESSSFDQDLDISSDLKESRTRFRRITKICLGLCISLLALSLGIFTYTSPHVSLLQPTGKEYGDCGNSITEARNKGCLFDPMSWNWVQPACYHSELISDFLNRTDWHFYSSPENLSANNEIPEEYWVRGDYKTLFATLKYHPVHCTYVWRKMHTAVLNHLPMDSEMLSMHHTEHCGMILVNDFLHEDPVCSGPPGDCLTILEAGFTRCGYY